MPPPEVEPGQRLVVVLDGNTSWEKVSVEGYRVMTMALDDELPGRLAGVSARLVVNLAAPKALESLSALRAAGNTSRFWGCIADATSNRALALGMVEPATRPLDPDGVLAGIGAYATRGTRVVTVGADVDALVSLRQALARQGMSVSMAWDGKQAADLFTMVKPEVIVLDLDLPRDGYAIAGRLAALEPIPAAVFIAGKDDANGFAVVLRDPAHTQRIVPYDKLLARIVVRPETQPEKR
jgi:CheY-like chemotaxis protein